MLPQPVTKWPRRCWSSSAASESRKCVKKRSSQSTPHPDGFQTSRRTSNESGENRVASGDAAPRYANWRRFSTRISHPTGFRLHPPGFFIGSSMIDVPSGPERRFPCARMPARSSHPLTPSPYHPLNSGRAIDPRTGPGGRVEDVRRCRAQPGDLKSIHHGPLLSLRGRLP